MKPTQSARPPASLGLRVSEQDSRANTFPKSARLLKHAGFQQVYENGRKQFSANMIFFYLLKEDASSFVKEGAPPLAPAVGYRLGNANSTVQIGLTVGRALGGAVDRNRIKRRMRDVVRHSLANLQDALRARGITGEVVINPKKAALTADMALLRAEVERGFQVISAAKMGDTPSR